MVPFSKRSILTLLLWSVICPTLHAGEADSTRGGGPIGFSPAFRGLQADATVFIFSACGGGSVDFDLFVLSVKSRAMTLGARFGPEWTGWGGAGGSGTHRMDYDLYMRTSVGGSVARFDLLLGYGWEGNTDPSSPPENVFKTGAEVRVKVLTNGTGLLFKLSRSRIGGFIGVGLFLGYDAN